MMVLNLGSSPGGGGGGIRQTRVHVAVFSESTKTHFFGAGCAFNSRSFSRLLLSPFHRYCVFIQVLLSVILFAAGF